MSLCDNRGCPGHLSKFPDCLTEALWEWSMDGSSQDDFTGDVDLDGVYYLFGVDEPETVVIDPDGVARTVIVPPGWHILHCASSGAVTSWVGSQVDMESEMAAHRGAIERYWDEIGESE